MTINVLADPAQGIVVIPAASRLTGEDGGWVRIGRELGVATTWFGDKGNATVDAAEDDTFALCSAKNFVGFQGGGRVFHLAGDSRKFLPLTFTYPNINWAGHGPSIEVGIIAAAAASKIISAHELGPAFRVRAENCKISELTSACSTLRTAATRITKDNYTGLGLTRDDMNPHFWVEAEDNADSWTTDTHLSFVAAEGGPSDGFVFIAGHYRSVITSCHARGCQGHGWVVDHGVYTSRTNKITAGVITIQHCTAIQCDGHSLVSGHPDNVSGHAVRVRIDDLDTYNCCQDDAILLKANYNAIFMGDNSSIFHSAISCQVSVGVGKSAIWMAGRDIELVDLRLLFADSVRAPIYWEGQHTDVATSTLRLSDGLRVKSILLTTDDAAPCPYIVEYANAGNSGPIVDDQTLDGTYGVAFVGPLNALDYRRFTTWVNRADQSFSNKLRQTGQTYMTSSAAQVIASGALAMIDTTLLVVDTEGAGATDDLDILTGGAADQLIEICTANNSRDVTIKHVAATNKFVTPAGADRPLTNVQMTWGGRFRTSIWSERFYAAVQNT